MQPLSRLLYNNASVKNSFIFEHQNHIIYANTFGLQNTYLKLSNIIMVKFDQEHTCAHMNTHQEHTHLNKNTHVTSLM